MSSTGKDQNRLQLRPNCTATFRTLYGFGKSKAIRLNSFLLNHPNQNQFVDNLNLVMNTSVGANILAKVPYGGKVRVVVYANLERKIMTYGYKARRLFQNLPTRGQRTRTNAQTSRKRNPYNILEINLKFFKGASITYKRLELLHNARYDELKIYDQRIQDNIEEAPKKEKKKKIKKKNV